MMLLLTFGSICSVSNRKSVDLEDNESQPSVSTHGRVNPNVLHRMSLELSKKQ